MKLQIINFCIVARNIMKFFFMNGCWKLECLHKHCHFMTINRGGSIEIIFEKYFTKRRIFCVCGLSTKKKRKRKRKRKRRREKKKKKKGPRKREGFTQEIKKVSVNHVFFRRTHVFFLPQLNNCSEMFQDH